MAGCHKTQRLPSTDLLKIWGTWMPNASLPEPAQAYDCPTPLQGSWTALHADVLSSYSWSSQICGRKRWRLLAPKHTHLLLDTFGRCTTLPWPPSLQQLRTCHVHVHVGLDDCSTHGCLLR